MTGSEHFSATVILPPEFGPGRGGARPPARRSRRWLPGVLLVLALLIGLHLVFGKGPAAGAAGRPLRVRLLRLGIPARVEIAGADLVLHGEDPAGRPVGDRLRLVWREGRLVGPDGRRHPGPVRVSGAGPLRVGSPERLYPGTLEVRPGPAGLVLVNHVDLEAYLPGVVAGELGDAWPGEALAAQAVAARTYACWQAANRARGPWDLTDTTRDQVYKGHVDADRPVARACRRTVGLVLTWRGEVLPAFYHSTCGGATAPAHRAFDTSPDLRPLAGVKCRHCRIATAHYRWRSAPIPPSRLLTLFGLPRGTRLLGLDAGGRKDTSGRWLQARLRTAAGDRTLPMRRLRRALGLKSSLILAVHRRAGGLVLQGGGWGHGVGLCQYGAVGQAKAGRSWRDILSYYFPGSAVEEHP